MFSKCSSLQDLIVCCGSILEVKIPGARPLWRCPCEWIQWQYRDDHLYISIQHSSAGSTLPEDYKVLILMVCAGSGPALLLCFVGERARLRAVGLTLAPALQFVGCRHPDRDMLFPVKSSRVGSFGWDADFLRRWSGPGLSITENTFRIGP